MRDLFDAGWAADQANKKELRPYQADAIDRLKASLRAKNRRPVLQLPTGGGKTEAYLGLTAFTLGLRRLQGEVAGHDGGEGVGVLMRYTLRLLTLQQFQRATALICAMEVMRSERAESGSYGATSVRSSYQASVGGTGPPMIVP